MLQVTIYSLRSGRLETRMVFLWVAQVLEPIWSATRSERQDYHLETFSSEDWGFLPKRRSR
jgi:hypothetical protein